MGPDDHNMFVVHQLCLFKNRQGYANVQSSALHQTKVANQAQTLEHLRKHQDKMRATQVPEQKPL